MLSPENPPNNRLYYIYLITNKINNKKYVGWSHSPKDRWIKHLWESVNGSEYYLHRALKKYGSDNFSFEVVYQSENGKHTRDIMESKFIKEYDSFIPNGYNMTRDGEGTLGYSHTPETRKKQSETRKSRLKTGEIIHGHLGTHHSQETKDRIFSKNAHLYNITFKDGRCITVKGLNTWARENKHSAGNLHNVLTGKRPFYKDIINIEKVS